jgi:ubiquinone/menaquinone biosynthesis C-methylase UbiE
MPAESMWASFFNVELVLSELQINRDIDSLVEIGFGYGTFTIPSARRIKGNLYAFDIDEAMHLLLKEKLEDEQIENVIPEHRDVLIDSTGLADNSADYFMLFNILHHESPDAFLNEAYRILKPEGKIGILHWRSDVETPRGPDLRFRPKPGQILSWIDRQKFTVYKEPVIVEPFHFGLVLAKR